MSDRPEVLDHLLEDDHDAIHLVYTHGSVHRYRLLNSTDEIEDGKKNSSSLRSHFERHGVIVIGYGGWPDATMNALQQAHQFDGNLYWCTRHGDHLPNAASRLLEEKASCAFKVVIPDANEAMHRIFKTLTSLNAPELLEDPVSLLIEQLGSLSFSESVRTQNAQESEQSRDLDSDNFTFSEPTGSQDGTKSEYIYNFNIDVKNCLARLKVARETYINPERYESGRGAETPVSDAQTTPQDTDSEMRSQAIVSKHMQEAIQLAKTDRLEEAIQLWSKVLDVRDISASQRASALMNRAMAYGRLVPSSTQEELADYSQVISISEAPAELRAKALVNRALTYGELAPPERHKEIEDYSTVMEMPDVSAKWKAIALLNRGMVYGDFDPPQRESQLRDYDAVVAMPDAPPESKAAALLNRAFIYRNLAPPREDAQLADYNALIAMIDAPVQMKASALFSRGVVYGNMNPPQRQKQLEDYSRVIMMADTPTALKAKALINRGAAYGRLEPARREDELADYTGVIEMPDAPPELRAQALINRAATYGELAPPRRNEQIADYTEVISTPNASPKRRAQALNGRAMAHARFDPPRREEVLADYNEVIDMPDAPAQERALAHGYLGLFCFDEYNDAEELLQGNEKALEYQDHYAWRYNIGLARLFMGKPHDAINQCLPAIAECSEYYSINDALQRLQNKHSILPEISMSAYEKIIRKLKEREADLLPSDTGKGG